MTGKLVLALLAATLALPAVAEYRRDPNEEQVWDSYATMNRTGRRSPQDRIGMDLATWRNSGSTLLLTATITNDNHFPVKDFAIACKTRGNSGTVIQELQMILYEYLPPGRSHRFVDIAVGYLHPQATRVGCDIAGAIAMD